MEQTVGKIEQLSQSKEIKGRNGIVYLSGKISIAAKSTYYRKDAAKRLRDAGFYTLDPMRGKPDSKSWAEYKPEELVHRDVQDVLRSKVVLSVIMTDGRKQSFGTPCEIALAWWNHVPVVLVTDDKTLANHPWVKHLCSKIFDNVEDAITYIIKYHACEDEGLE